MRASFYMDRQVRGARFGKGFQQPLRVFHHQVHIDWQICATAAMPDDEGAHRQVGDKVTVHHIDMNPVRTGGLAGLQNIAQMQKV